MPSTDQPHGPLRSLDEWDDFVKSRYPEAAPGEAPGQKPFVAANADKKPEAFRDYRAEARASVKEFYRLNHTYQTREFVLQKKREYLARNKSRMGVWQAMEYLNTLVDDSDPDTDLSQIEHLLQVAEAIRHDGRPRWFILTGLLHDLGKILCLEGEPQWAVVGDTFPVGCAFSDKIVFSEFFADNPDSQVPAYQTPCGVYQAGCGFANVLLTWRHDEYLSTVLKDYVSEDALYMIVSTSSYPGTAECA